MVLIAEFPLPDGVTVVLYNVMQTYNRLQAGGGTIDALQVNTACAMDNTSWCA